MIPLDQCKDRTIYKLNSRNLELPEGVTTEWFDSNQPLFDILLALEAK